MGFLDKVLDTVSNAAVNMEANASVERQDSIELKKLNTQLEDVKKELDSSYAQIGRKYVDFIDQTGTMGSIDISDLLRIMQPKIKQKEELDKKIIELEKKMKDAAILREKQQVESDFLAEKEQLDKALAMDVLSQAEYDAKITSARKRVENFEEIRRIEKQYEMNLISYDEKQAKINALLVG